jgi:hypothetical protein
MSNISITTLSATDEESINQLSGNEMRDVAGGNILIYGGPVVVGFAAGTLIRLGVDKLVSWLF